MRGTRYELLYGGYGVSWGGWECSQSTGAVVIIEKPGRIHRNGAETRNILMVYYKTAVFLVS